MARQEQTKVRQECSACPEACPELAPENYEAWELWEAVKTQWRAGFGLIGMDYGAVYMTADRLGLEVTPAVLTKIRALEHMTLDRLRPKEATTKNG